MKQRLALGIILMLLAELCFTLLWVSVKFSGDFIPVFEIAFFRGLVSAVIIGNIMISRGISFRIQNKRSMLGRCISGYLAMLLSFFSLTKIGLGNAVTLLHTSPIFVAVISPILLKERSNKLLLFWIISAFVGITLILKPDENILQDYSLLALLGGFLAGIAYITIRHLHRTENTFTITFYFTLFVSISSFPLMIKNFVMPNLIGWLALLGAGIFGTFAQLLMTHSYKCGPANILTPFNNSAIIFSFIFGWVFWNETPDLLTLIGALLIIVAIVFVSFIANRRRITKELPVVGETSVR